MKAAQNGTILAFNFSGDNYRKLDALCRKQGLRMKTLSAEKEPEAFALSIGDLLSGGVITASETLSEEARLAISAMAFPEEMMVLSNLNSSALDKFLKGIREADLWIPLKAVATPTNAGWKPMALKLELMQEHAAMQAAIQARQDAANE